MIDLARCKSYEQIAFIYRNKQFSHGEVNEVLKRLECTFSKRKLILLICSNTLVSAMAYIACLRYGSVPIMLDSSTGDDLVRRITDVYKPDEIIDGSSLVCSSEEIVEYIQSSIKSCNANTCLNKELAILLTTSGSTGSPKLVKISYDNIKSNTASIAQYLEIDNRSRHITTLPFAYTYGLSAINTHIWKGGSCILNNSSVIEKNFWELIDDYKPSTISGVPYTYEMLSRGGFARLSESSIVTYTQAGGSMSEVLRQKIESELLRPNNRFIVMYGQTEATARMAYLPPEEFTRRPGSIGMAIPGGKLVIENNRKQGELVYYGPNVFMGYAEKVTSLSRGDEQHGCLRTGDYAKVDEDGFFYVVGRNSSFVKCSGIRINLTDLEHLLERKGFTCAAVFRKGIVYIKIESDIASDCVTAKDYLTSQLSLSPSHIRVSCIEKLRRKANGKIDYTDL